VRLNKQGVRLNKQGVRLNKQKSRGEAWMAQYKDVYEKTKRMSYKNIAKFAI